MTEATKNHWRFERVNSQQCRVRDTSNTVYLSAFGDLAAHKCQDFIRWTEVPKQPGGQPNEPWALKPAEATS